MTLTHKQKSKAKAKPKPTDPAYWANQKLPSWAGKYAKPGGGGVEKWRADELAYYQKYASAGKAATGYTPGDNEGGGTGSAMLNLVQGSGGKGGAFTTQDAAQLHAMNKALPHPHKKKGLAKYGPGLAIAGSVLGGIALEGASAAAGAAGASEATGAAGAAVETGGAAAGLSSSAAELAAGGVAVDESSGGFLDDAFSWLRNAGQTVNQDRAQLEQLGADFGIGGGGGSGGSGAQAPSQRSSAPDSTWSKYGLWIVGGLGAILILALFLRRR